MIAKFVTDKMPLFVLEINLCSVSEAKIIHVKRDQEQPAGQITNKFFLQEAKFSYDLQDVELLQC